MQIPFINSTSGFQSDGGFYGYVQESLLTAYLVRSVLTSSVHVVSVNNTTAGDTFIDLSSPASDTITADTPIFGIASDISSPDALYISDSAILKEIWFNISTAGVLTADGIDLFDSSNGVSANRQLSITSDGTNAFRNSGWNKLSWTTPSSDSQAFALSPSSSVSMLNTPRIWYKVKFRNFVSATTAPILSRILGIYPTDGQKYLDVTAQINGGTNQNPAPAPLATSFFPTNDDELIFITSNPFYALDSYVYKSLPNYGGFNWTYYASDGTYKPLTALNDTTSNFTAGPSTLTTPPTRFETTWALPSDMASVTKTYNLTSGSSSTYTGYQLRLTPIGVSPVGEYVPSSVVRRVKQFGNSNTVGETQLSSRTLNGVVIEHVGVITANTTCEVVNLTTGKASTFTVHTTDTIPMTIDIPNLQFSASDKLGIMFVSGGEMRDVEIDFVWQ